MDGKAKVLTRSHTDTHRHTHTHINTHMNTHTHTHTARDSNCCSLSLSLSLSLSHTQSAREHIASDSNCCVHTHTHTATDKLKVQSRHTSLERVQGCGPDCSFTKSQVSKETLCACRGLWWGFISWVWSDSKASSGSTGAHILRFCAALFMCDKASRFSPTLQNNCCCRYTLMTHVALQR